MPISFLFIIIGFIFKNIGGYFSFYAFFYGISCLLSAISLKFFEPKRVILVFSIFIIAFTARFYLISTTQKYSNFIDLCTYIDSGQLVSHGINPYDYSDGVGIRNKLRTDGLAFNPVLCKTQRAWSLLHLTLTVPNTSFPNLPFSKACFSF